MDNSVEQKRWQGVGIVRDKYNRIVVDDAVFHNKEQLEQLRLEVINNGRNSSDSNP